MPSLSVLLRLYCIALVEVVFCQNIGLEVERICCQRFECEELFGTGNWEGRGGGRLPCSELLWPWVKNLHWRLLVFHTLVAPLHWYTIQHMDDMRTACCLQPLSLTGEEFRFHWDLSVSALPAWQPVLSPSPFTYRRGIPFPLLPVCFSISCLAALQRHGECLALVNKRLEVDHDNPDLYVMRARLHEMFRNVSGELPSGRIRL